jgi:ParB family chromosome partitioning protein
MNNYGSMLIVPVSTIRVDKRTRNDFGDIAELSRSIAEVGLLNPITVTPDYQLVAGGRRLKAIETLGWETVPVCVMDNLTDLKSQLDAESDENGLRKDFTPSEKVFMGERIRHVVEEDAKRRMKEGKKKKDEEVQAESNGDKSEEKKGTTREIVAEAVGLSWPTYQKAAEIVAAAEQDPEKFGDILKKMDETENISAAYNQMKKIKEEAVKPKKTEGETAEILDADNVPVPARNRLRDKFSDQILALAADKLEVLAKSIKAVDSELKQASNENPWLMYAEPDDKIEAIHDLLHKARESAKKASHLASSAKPHIVCKKCKGKGCKECRSSGFLPMWRAAEIAAEIAAESAE